MAFQVGLTRHCYKACAGLPGGRVASIHELPRRGLLGNWMRKGPKVLSSLRPYASLSLHILQIAQSLAFGLGRENAVSQLAGWAQGFRILAIDSYLHCAAVGSHDGNGFLSFELFGETGSVAWS